MERKRKKVFAIAAFAVLLLVAVIVVRAYLARAARKRRIKRAWVDYQPPIGCGPMGRAEASPDPLLVIALLQTKGRL